MVFALQPIVTKVPPQSSSVLQRIWEGTKVVVV
jgi:hypothetical protein